MVEPEGMTMEQMCETIVRADFLRTDDGRKLTAREIYDASPTGELWHVFALYDYAQKILREGVDW